MISRRSFFAAAFALPIAAQERRPFRWPAGKRAAISLTFDDARVSQIDTVERIARYVQAQQSIK
jgi:hypothetical protein